MNKKKQAPKGWLKIVEFEQKTGINNRTVRLAIKNGAIPAKCVCQVGNAPASPLYINPQPAALHWYGCLNANHHLSKTLRDSLAKYIRTFDPAAVGDEKPAKKKGNKVTPDDTDKMTLSEAQRRERVAKAKEAELDLKKKEGSLVEKARVHDQLFTAAQELRNALLAVPDRVIDQIIAASSNRTRALNVLYDAIAAELEKLADVGINE